jgi:signal transduction histidine kinase
MMEAAKSATQTGENPRSIQSIIKWWLEPRSTDRDEAFRERVLRVATALVVTLGMISFLLTVFVYQNEWAVVSLPTLHIAVLAGFGLSAYFVSRMLILPAAWSIVIVSHVAAAGVLLLIQQADATLITGIPLFVILVLVGALVLPRNSILPISITSVVTYGTALYLAQLSAVDPSTYDISQAVTAAAVIIPAVGVILHRLRVEFDARHETLEESLRQTELARRQAELQRRRAEEADKAKSQFLANMSHELRTPLNAIIGYDEAMLGGMVGEFTEQQTKLLGHIQHNSRRLLNLINDILDLSKVESGSLQVFLAPMSPNKVIRETVENLRSLADEKNIYLKTQFADDVPEVVLGDANKLQQALVNVLSNAIKFTDQGGVTVDVGVVDSRRWRFTVHDTGVGMPSDAASYIFEPFQQVDGTDKRKYKGTGLGLAITKRLVERLGGTIEVTTEPGKGAAFTITLPRAHVPAVSKPEEVEVKELENG